MTRLATSTDYGELIGEEFGEANDVRSGYGALLPAADSGEGDEDDAPSA